MNKKKKEKKKRKHFAFVLHLERGYLTSVEANNKSENMPNEKLVLHIQDEILMIIVDQKQCRNSRSCSSSHVLPKIPPIHEKTPAQESRLNSLFKKKPHRRWIPRESGKTSKNTPYIEHLQRQFSTILKTSSIFCSTKRSANKYKV